MKTLIKFEDATDQIKLKTRSSTIISISILALSFIAIIPQAVYASAPIIYSEWMTAPVTVDGVWSAGEWDDAAEAHITLGTTVDFEYYLYVKNDNNWIYVCMDVVGDNTLDDGDQVIFGFDTGHNEVLTHGSEDAIGYARGDELFGHNIYDTTWEDWDFHCSSACSVPFTDHGRDEAGMVVAAGFTGTPNSDIHSLYHSIYEFKIPMALGDLNAYPSYTAGIIIQVYDASANAYSFWPTEVSWPDASTWGDLVLTSSSYVMSEIDSIIFDAPADSVYFVPTGNIYDDSAFYAYAENPQIITSPTQSDASSAYLDSDGSPLFAGDIVTFGGRFANRMVAHFEDTGVALVGYGWDGTHHLFRRISDDSTLYAIEGSTYNPAEKDYVAFQIYSDGISSIFSVWGFSAQRTYAGGLCFINQIWPHIEDYTNSWYIYSWTDLNADGMPQPEEITLEASGI